MRDVLIDRKRQTSFIIVQARVIARMNVTFVLFERCITDILLFPCVFEVSALIFAVTRETREGSWSTKLLKDITQDSPF